MKKQTESGAGIKARIIEIDSTQQGKVHRSKIQALQEKLKDLRCLGIEDLGKYGRDEMGMENITPQIPKEILFKMVAYRLQDSMGLGSERADQAESKLLKYLKEYSKELNKKIKDPRGR